MADTRKFPRYMAGGPDAMDDVKFIAWVLGSFYNELAEKSTEEVAADLTRSMGEGLINRWLEG